MTTSDSRAGESDRIRKMGILFHQPDLNKRGEYLWAWSSQSDSWWEIKRGFTGWPAAPTGPYAILLEDKDGTRHIVQVDPEAVSTALEPQTLHERPAQG